jgi:hypothetical protein
VQDLLLDLAVRVEELQKTCAVLAARPAIATPAEPAAPPETGLEECLLRLRSLGAAVTIQIGGSV